jgi:L-alanine-DL-glutamate epimerase-like enolase superfamily enzyme
MSVSRRKFINTVGMTIPGLVFAGTLPQYLIDSKGNAKIDSVSLYLVNVKKARNFSHSTWHNRQHIFVKIQSGRHIGWAESLANKNDLDFDISKWGAFLNDLKGLSISEGIEYTRDKFISRNWNAKKSEPVLIALYDILGKIANKPTIELWGLDKRDPVPGLFCILERDVDQALVQAEIAKKQNLTTHVKVKMFGDTKIDLALTVALRKSFGKDTFLMADANRGYKQWKNLDELAMSMKNLHAAGLDAMEDPAELTAAQWAELQIKVGDFALIPDRPMRPAYKALDLFSPEMGVYFNIHPDTMGTFKEAVQLGKKIKSNNRGLMIGDSSLVGPACTFWQQLAIGVGASWVEALEKPQESTVFQECVKEMSTAINSQGKVEITKLQPGFGVEMDEVKLKSLSDAYTQLF